MSDASAFRKQDGLDMRKKNGSTKKTPEVFASRRFFFWSELFIRASVTFAVTAILTVFLISMVNDALALYKDEKEAQISASSARELANKLGEAGIVDHPWLFSLYARVKGTEEIGNKGEVRVSSDMDYRQLLRAFIAAPKSSIVRLSIPEGATTDEIIDLFVSNGFGSREGFADTINNYPFEYDFISALSEKNGRRYRLDGYLYPDTYDFYTGRSEAYYIYKLLDRFVSVTDGVREGISDADFDGILTVASMIQRSTVRVGQYEYLSRVFYNRLNNSESYPFLNCPATSVYGMSGGGGVYKGRATDDIMSAPTPYNTFTNKGLPPGAICNPSINAIVCAIRPANGTYKYFVTDLDGETLFASTKREHETNCATIKETD